MSPSYLKELVISQYNHDYLNQLLAQTFFQNQQQYCAIFVKMNHHNYHEIESNLKKLREVLRTLKIHPRFPYPMYIVTDKVQAFQDFLIIKDESLITPYFKNLLKPHAESHSKISHKQDKQLLFKINFMREKLRYLDIDKYFSIVEFNKKSNQKLCELVCESSFYKNILESLDQIK